MWLALDRLFPSKVNSQQVQDFKAVSKNQSTVELAWTNPSKVNITKLKLNYTIREPNYRFNQTVSLGRYLESYVVTGLLPGSLVNFYLTTIVGEEEKGTSQLTVLTCKYCQ